MPDSQSEQTANTTIIFVLYYRFFKTLAQVIWEKIKLHDMSESQEIFWGTSECTISVTIFSNKHIHPSF